MSVLLSIVVPVYNVKPYLDKCVNSLLRQDLEKDQYEIILVDDGSTDGSQALCDAIAAREMNVSVIHQANQGLSCARNAGMRMAGGKYIQFVDSDDFLADHVLGVLVECMERQELEILQFGYLRVNEGEETPKASSEVQVEQGPDEVMDGPTFMIKRLWYSCYACQFMLRRSFLEEYGLTFKPGILFEDTEWTPRVMQKARRVSSINRLVYFYLLRGGSITSGAGKEKKIASIVARMEDLSDQMRPLEDKRWYRGMISQMAVGIITTVALYLYKDRKRYLDILKAHDVFPLSPFLATKKGRRKIRLINMSPRLACYLIHATNQHLSK